VLGLSLVTPETYLGNTKGIATQDAIALKEAGENHIRTGYPSIRAQITNLYNLDPQRKSLYEIATGQPAPDDWSSFFRISTISTNIAPNPT
jgi:hypothetical protein